MISIKCIYESKISTIWTFITLTSISRWWKDRSFQGAVFIFARVENSFFGWWREFINRKSRCFSVPQYVLSNMNYEGGGEVEAQIWCQFHYLQGDSSSFFPSPDAFFRLRPNLQRVQSNERGGWRYNTRWQFHGFTLRHACSSHCLTVIWIWISWMGDGNAI